MRLLVAIERIKIARAGSYRNAVSPPRLLLGNRSGARLRDADCLVEKVTELLMSLTASGTDLLEREELPGCRRSDLRFGEVQPDLSDGPETVVAGRLRLVVTLFRLSDPVVDVGGV